MTTYFHVAPAAYQAGDDLLCWNELENLGYELTWKYDGEPVDTDVVCLFESKEEAHEFIGDFLPDGQLLTITIPDDDDYLHMTRVQEGYPAVHTCIPARYIA